MEKVGPGTKNFLYPALHWLTIRDIGGSACKRPQTQIELNRPTSSPSRRGCTQVASPVVRRRTAEAASSCKYPTKLTTIHLRPPESE